MLRYLGWGALITKILHKSSVNSYNKAHKNTNIDSKKGYEH